VTPALPDMLMGQAMALSAPQPPESAGDYMAGRIGMIAMLAVLAAQEAERGLAARTWENGALIALFERAAPAYDAVLAGDLARAAAEDRTDHGWGALDRANADLRRVLVRLHEAAEDRGDSSLDREILTLYQAMAKARHLDLPSALAG
jgi:hypothetical protein